MKITGSEKSAVSLGFALHFFDCVVHKTTHCDLKGIRKYRLEDELPWVPLESTQVFSIISLIEIQREDNEDITTQSCV